MLWLIFTVVLILIGVSALLWAVQAAPWMDSNLKQFIRIIVILLVVFWIIGLLIGMIPPPGFLNERLR